MDVVVWSDYGNCTGVVEKVRQAAQHVIGLPQEDWSRLFVEGVLILGKCLEILVFKRLQRVSHFHQFILEALLRPNINGAALEILDFYLHSRTLR